MKAKAIRCAIYTRKSTEDGLEQEFNSLDAQRAACEAYVLSQAGEGWIALPQVFDDGGFSGGTMERPALRALLKLVAAREIDVIVVYKVDRLTRSLTDFAKIVDVLDSAGASFVSVTQAFNTTTSMGRLTLNVLLSFAQFEREVTGERIRDKIAASKARGMWMGGMLCLGYDLADRRLVVNPTEAELIRSIFRRYLELGSVHRLRDELEAAGTRSKRWQSTRGREMGGAVIGRGGLYHMLKNRLYLGEIVHRGKAYPGQHPPIIDAALFDRVQASLAANVVVAKARRAASAKPPLAGRIFDADGRRLSPTFAYGRRGRRYRYYIASDLQVGAPGRCAETAIRRIGADELERFLLNTVRRITGDPQLPTAALPNIVARLEVGVEETQMVVDVAGAFANRHPQFVMKEVRARLRPGEHAAWEGSEPPTLRVLLPVRMQFRGGRVWRIGVDAADQPRPNRGLIAGLRRAHSDLKEVRASPICSAADLAIAAAPTSPHARQLSRLAFLAPDLQRLILEGRQPPGMTLRSLLKSELPLAWEDQRIWFSRVASVRSEASSLVDPQS